MNEPLDAMLAELTRPVMHFSGAIRPDPEMAALEVGATMYVRMDRAGRAAYLMPATVTRRTVSASGVDLTAEFTMEDGSHFSLGVRVPPA